ncbi:hypothetical protein SJAV_16990 [Sulfurisphaera javensis]|uniref:Uncharacterized protein n=1 Tax=Sulfurisphaera javensis TaxID=2049879 RepID=A0AAT9GSS1_9CREN
MVYIDSLDSSLNDLLKFYNCKDCRFVNFIVIKDEEKFFDYLFKKNDKIVVIISPQRGYLVNLLKDLASRKGKTVHVLLSSQLNENTCVVCFC